MDAKSRSLIGVSAVTALALLLGGCSSWKKFAYEGFSRDDWQQPQRVIEELGISAGDRVADIGAGAGYFSFKIADAVGSEGRVFAVDVDPDMLEYLRERVADEGRGNVEVIAGEYHDPLLPEAGVDVILTVNTYHHIEDRPAYFRNLKRALRPGGRVGIVELSDASWFPRTFGHMSEKASILSEMQAAGYRVDRDLEYLERQHFIVLVPER